MDPRLPDDQLSRVSDQTRRVRERQGASVQTANRAFGAPHNFVQLVLEGEWPAQRIVEPLS